ncbi:hypothetical protein ASPFODRAFT_592050 [Aspergillus luchuensis CBS 106.47]|uniref:Uncharacterized protein n=1 Tax=Aspergillus luchuensis (strain CBS 106.47) TaxID=1137211 RepID=A0A1M3TM29_ASPLC|nr:hypothetical protein ASPFODRAFT_592050 [Aspergillus luchuensis CBS 106.47]
MGGCIRNSILTAVANGFVLSHLWQSLSAQQMQPVFPLTRDPLQPSSFSTWPRCFGGRRIKYSSGYLAAMIVGCD